jgi:hypothetical protein
MIEAVCGEIMKNKGTVQLGFHLHDHFQMSVANALMLKDCGYDLTDVSITGEGKGGGNLKTEFIIPIYRCLYGGTITAKELCNLYDLIVFFNQLIDRCGEFYEKAFIDSLTGLYKATLKKLDVIETIAVDDAHRYIHLITGEEEI